MPSSNYRFRGSTINAGIASVLREERRVQEQRRRQQRRSRLHRRRERELRRQQQQQMATASPQPPSPSTDGLLPPVTPELLVALADLDPPVLPIDIAPHLLRRAGDEVTVSVAVRAAMEQLNQAQMTTRVMDALEWLAEVNVIFDIPAQPSPPPVEDVTITVDIEEWITQQRQTYVDNEYVGESFHQSLKNDIAGDSDMCGICFEEYTDSSIIRIFDCHHAYDQECIDEWLITTGSDICPMCHAVIIPEEI